MAYGLKLAAFVAAVHVVLPACALAAQGSRSDSVRKDTADVVRGRVLGPDSLPAANALVTLTPTKAGKRVSDRTGADGKFRFVIPNGAGDYELVVRVVGMARIQQTVKRSAPGDLVVPDIYLQGAAALKAVDVVATKREAPTAGEASRESEADTKEYVQDGGRGTSGSLINALSRMSGVLIRPDGFSVLGMSASQNNVTLNGSTFSGGMVPSCPCGSPHGALVTNTYDVSRGGFSGGQLAFQSWGGAPMFYGTLSAGFDHPRMQWTDPTASRFGQTYRNSQLNLMLNGPIFSEKFSYLAGFSLGQRSSDLQTLLRADTAALTRLGIASDSLSRFLSALGQSGVPLTRPGLPDDDRTRNNSVSIRVDHGSMYDNQKHTQAVSVVFGSNTRDGYGLDGRAVPLAGGATTNSHFFAQFGASDRIRDALLNQFFASVSTNRTRNSRYVELPAGRVNVASTLSDNTGGLSTLTFGGNAGVGARSRSFVIDVRDEASWQSLGKKHLFKATLGTIVTRLESSNATNRLGSYTFNSLEDLDRGQPASFTRTLNAPTQHGGTVATAASLQDSWRPTSRFQLLYGVRLEETHFLHRPGYNQDVERIFGYRTSFTPRDLSAGPSLAFNWSYGKDERGSPRGTITGGVRRFIGTMGAPSMDATGLSTALKQITCIGAAIPLPNWSLFGQDPTAIPDECVGTADPVFINTQPNVSVMDPSYRAARRLGSTLGWSGRAPGVQLKIGLEYSRGSHQEGGVDLNLVTAPRFALPGEATRPVFVNVSSIVPSSGAVGSREARINDSFGQVLLRQSDLGSIARQVTVNLRRAEREPRAGSRINLEWNVSYLYADNLTETRGFTGTTGGNPFLSEWGPSGQPTHTINLVLNVGPAWGGMYDLLPRKDWGQISANIRIISGMKYTPTVLGDVNGDGLSNDRAFIFDPTSSDPTAASMAALLASAPSTAQQCLRAQLGAIANRNSCTGPWSTSMDLTYTPNLRRFLKRSSLRITMTNPLGGLDQLMHGWDDMHGWGQPAVPDPLLLTVKGFDAANQRFIYDVNRRFGETRRNAFHAPFTLRIDATYMFDRRDAWERNRMQKILGLDEEGKRPQMTLDSLKRRIGSSGAMNIFRVAVDYRDTILLVDEQLTRITMLERQFLVEEDSLLTERAKRLMALGDDPSLLEFQKAMGTGGDEAASRQAQAREGLRTAKWGRLLRDILTPEQWQQLPHWTIYTVESAMAAEEALRKALARIDAQPR
jgi:hypothetical protein